MWKVGAEGQAGVGGGGRIQGYQFGAHARGKDYLTPEIQEETQKPSQALGKLGPEEPSIFDTCRACFLAFPLAPHNKIILVVTMDQMTMARKQK